MSSARNYAAVLTYPQIVGRWEILVVGSESLNKYGGMVTEVQDSIEGSYT